MKIPIIVCVLIFASSVLEAQMPLDRVDTFHKKSQGYIDVSKHVFTNGNYSHSTSIGKVYILPDDNMPCLVPRMHELASMPVSNRELPQSKMPNAIPRKKLIPRQNK